MGAVFPAMGLGSVCRRRLALGVSGSVTRGFSLGAGARVPPMTTRLLAPRAALTAGRPIGQPGWAARRSFHAMVRGGVQAGLGAAAGPRGLLVGGGRPMGLGAAPPTWHTRPLTHALPQDVLLFRHDRVKFFRLLGLFTGAQFLFWIYLAHFAFTSLRDTGYEETVLAGEQTGGLPKIGGLTLNLGSDKWRYGFTASCLTVGSLILGAGSLLARRSVSSVLLLRGGQQVTISSYLPFGGTRALTVPLRHVSCVAHRSQSPAVIPLKIRGRRFYYLLDKRGQFYNAKLFDSTVGAYRKL